MIFEERQSRHYREETQRDLQSTKEELHDLRGQLKSRLIELDRYERELTVALDRLQCDRALALLSEAVTEYQPSGEVRDYVWTRKQPAQLGDNKVLDLAAKRRLAEYTGASAPPVRRHEPPTLADVPAL